MPKKFPPEFKRDVVRVARRGDLTHAEVAADFDISVESVRRWVRQADIDDDHDRRRRDCGSMTTAGPMAVSGGSRAAPMSTPPVHVELLVRRGEGALPGV